MPEEALSRDDASAPAGWYGKLPSLGDFASRRLPDAFVQVWDEWLQQGIGAARAALGEARWLDAYLVAPVLRFWLAPGLAGEWGYGGVLMPSVDRVGRHFPLTLAQPVDTAAAALGAGHWYAGLDAAARRVLDPAFTLDDFEGTLSALLPRNAPHADALATAWLGDGAPACSLWWCGNADALTEHRRFPGLPPAAQFGALMGAQA